MLHHTHPSLAACLALATILAACSSPPQPAKTDVISSPKPGTVAYDRDVWHSLLADHKRIRREVVFTPTGVEATTESDDPDVAARLLDHAQAMQRRMRTGSRVRIWDPVFDELFKSHDKVTLSLTATAKGVRIVESSDDPEVVKLLHAHASGVSDFVREGFEASARETPRSPAVTITQPAAISPNAVTTNNADVSRIVEPARPSRRWGAVKVNELTETQRLQRDRAVAARDEMFSRLYIALGSAVQQNGPASSIDVCQDQARQIASAVGGEKGVRIGRAGDRSGHPSSTDPDWLAEALRTRPESERYVAADDGSFGITLPIHMSAACIACHGPAESISPQVREALAAKFPSGPPTGFKEGDLRGWFWVEVAPTSAGGANEHAKSPG